MIETLLYGYVTWILRAEDFAKLRTVHHQALLRVVGFQRRLRTDNTTLSCAKALKMTRCESIETAIRNRTFFAEAVGQQSKERLPSRVVFETMVGGKNPRPGGQLKTWQRCMVEDLKDFRASEGRTEHSPFVSRIDAAPWATAARKAG